MNRLILILVLLFGMGVAPAMAGDCDGIYGANQICGSVAGGAPKATNSSSFNLTSAQIDAICSTNNDFLIRSSGTWQCGSAGTGLSSSGGALAITAKTGAARADLNGSNWTFTTPSPTNSYVLIPWSHAPYNIGSLYIVYPGSYSTGTPPTNTLFQPPSGTTLVCFASTVLVSSGGAPANGRNAIIKIIKNFVVNSSGVIQSGTDVVEGDGFNYYGNTGLVGFSLSGCDHPGSTDYYGLFIYIDGTSGTSGGDSITVSGNVTHSNFSMSVIY